MALYILAAVLLLIVFLLFCRVHIYASYQGKRFISGVRYLFIRYEYNPDKPKKGKKGEEEPEEDKGKEKPAQKQGLTLAKFREMFDEFSALIRKLGDSLLKRMRVDSLKLDASVYEEDAAQTAIEYGLLCSAVYPLVAYLNGKFLVKKQEISIQPVFSSQGGSGQSELRFSCDLTIRLGSLIAAGAKAAGTFFYLIFRKKRTQGSTAGSTG